MAKIVLQEYTKNISCIYPKIVQVTVVLGAQWGDEGKGKVVDLLAGQMDLVCRYVVYKPAMLYNKLVIQFLNLNGSGFQNLTVVQGFFAINENFI